MNPSRRTWLQHLAVFAALPSGVLAQPKARTASIGWLSYLPEPDPAVALLREGLRELHYEEGRHYRIVARYAGGDFTRLPRLVEELAAGKVDVLVTRGPSTDFTKAVRSQVPIVFAYSGDPVEAGFGDSLRNPGRNMTGITFMAVELSAKRVEVLKELLPKAARIALLSNPEHAGELAEYRSTEDSAKRLGASITRFLVKTPQELTTGFEQIRASAPDAMLVFPDSLTLSRRKNIADFAAQAKIPCMYGWTEFVESGGLISYGPSLTENFKTLAVFVDKVLRGEAAGSIPIEQVRRIALTLNLRAAKALNLQVPQALLVRADRIIE